MTTAVLGRPAPGRRSPRWVAGLVSGSPSLVRALPTTVLLAATAVLLAVGVLPVVDGELVGAGLALGFLATGLARLVDRGTAAGDGTVVVPVAQFGAIALISAGTAAPAVLFLLFGPVLALALTPRRRGVLAAIFGTAAVLLLPGLLDSEAPPPVDLPLALFLGPLSAGLGTLAGHDAARRAGRQAAELEVLRAERSALEAQVRTRADELDVATRMLAARAQTMTSVIDAVTEQSIIGTDTDGIIRVWNPGAERMLGLPRADVVRTRSIVEFHVPSELEAASEEAGSPTGMAALVTAAQENGSDVRDWTYVGADGRQRTVSVAITPRTDDQGAHAGWNFVGTDMTEVRATERMKDQFVSLISHELRTPLSSILGYLELVLDDEEQTLTEEQRAYLGTVERNAHRLQRLVGDLLFTAQVEAGRFTLQPEDVDLAGVVRAAEETARVSASAGGVEIHVDVPDDGLVVPGDAVRLGQACDNLVSNAVKFTRTGGRVTLSVRSAWRLPDGSIADTEQPGAEAVARLSVTDTGVGIPAGEQGKLFTRFFRASTAQRNAVPGVGLGLTITKAITTAHGGTLDVHSVEDQGTTFTLTLPR